jgi:hypothetical protein
MHSDGPRLAIDYGSSTAVAVVVWPDGRWVTLPFDGGAVLSSAVHVGGGGEPVVGAAAWARAVPDPAGLVAAPLDVDADTVPVGGSHVAVSDLVAATLRWVRGEAVRVTGGPVTDVRMVVPAEWGPRRRTWLRHAAFRAGLGQPRLVDAPVAAAERLLATGVQVPVGSFLLLVDVGGGCEVTVLRRGPTGFEVLSTLTDRQAGGGRVDDALVAAVLGVDGAGSAGGLWWAALPSVRAGKEAVSQLPTATVMLPDRSPAPVGAAVPVLDGAPAREFSAAAGEADTSVPVRAVVLSAAAVRDAAGPVLQRVGEVAAEAVTAAELTPDRLAGVYVFGGTAAMPAVPAALGEGLGVAVQVIPDPGWAAVLGAAAAAGPTAHTAVSAGPGLGQVTVVPEQGLPRLRRLGAVAASGVLSLTLFAQFVTLVSFHNGSRDYRGPNFYVLANWGELAVAGLFAVLSCLTAGSWFGAALTRAAAAPGPGSARHGEPVAGQVGTGILAATAAGVAVAGLYAVVASLVLGVPAGSPLRWSLLPVLPVAVAALTVAWLAVRSRRVPAGGWDAFLTFPVASVLSAAVGTALVAAAMGASRPAGLGVWIDAAGRVGGLLIGLGVACALLGSWLWRLVLAAPLGVLAAAVVSWPATGLLAAVYAAVVAGWWGRRLWDLLRAGAQTTPEAA